MTTAVASIGLPAPLDSKKNDSPAVTVREINSVETAPSGFKLVKVKKPDGTIVTVKRPVAIASKQASPVTNDHTVVIRSANVTKTADVAILPSTSKPAAIPVGTESQEAKPQVPKIADNSLVLSASGDKNNVKSTAPKAKETAPPKLPVTVQPISNTPGIAQPKAAPAPAIIEPKAPLATASTPAKKSWFGGIGKGLKGLNVDKIANAIDSIDKTTARIDAALKGQPIPAKSTPAASTTPKLATTQVVKPVASTPAQTTTAAVLQAIPSNISARAISQVASPTTTNLLKAGSSVEAPKPAAQNTGATQPAQAIVLQTSAAPVLAKTATQSLAPTKASPVVVVKTPAQPQSVSQGFQKPASPQTSPAATSAVTPVTQVTTTPRAPVMATPPPAKPTQAKTTIQAPAKAINQTPKQTPATTQTARLTNQPTARAPVSQANQAGPTTARSRASQAILGDIGNAAIPYGAQHPYPGPSLSTRSINDGPTKLYQDNQDQAASPYPIRAMNQDTATREIPGADHSGLAEGALGLAGGAALGVGGGLAYEEYEDYADGDEVVEDEGDHTTTADQEIMPEDEADEEVYEDYNPDEDEVVGEELHDEAPADEEPDLAEAEPENEGDEAIEEYDPEQDVVIEDDDEGAPQEVEAQPEQDLSGADPSEEIEEPEPEAPLAEVHEMDSGDDLLEDDQPSYGDDADF